MRNLAVFEDKLPNIRSSFNSFLTLIKTYNQGIGQKINRQIGSFNFTYHRRVGFFDGSAIDGLCAVGGVLYINKDHYFKLKMNCGTGSNTKAELLGLWCIITVAAIMGLQEMTVFGDSWVTIKWALKEYDFNIMTLQQWCRRVQDKILCFKHISFGHIYREFSMIVDTLSKEAHGGDEGFVFWTEYIEDQACDFGRVNLFEF